LKLFAIIPVKKFEYSKSRMGQFFSVEERVRLSQLLLDQTIKTLKKTTTLSEIIVVSIDKRAQIAAEMHNISFLKEDVENGVNAAVNIADCYCIRHGADATIVVPEDLPLLVPNDIDMMYDIAIKYEKCLLICPSIGYDGSNLLVRKPPNLLAKTHYDNGNSYYSHIISAMGAGAYVKVIFSEGVMKDLDTLEDAKCLVSQGNKVGNHYNKMNNSSALLFLKSKFDSMKS
jgi:2-phospho-L-lactate/phosphoenolpyruvate guanylyltransferase